MGSGYGIYSSRFILPRLFSISMIFFKLAVCKSILDLSVDEIKLGLIKDKKDVRKYYIVPKEAQQDYRKLISYWLHDISNGAGYAWIIYQKKVACSHRTNPVDLFLLNFVTA